MNRVVVIGASAGGLEALRLLVSALPKDFAAPVCVVMHTAPQSPGVLAQILARSTALRAVNPRNKQRLQPGHIYVAPPDHHLLTEPGRVCLTKGPHENRFRPAIDPLFRSAAQVYGPGAVGVILTGNLDDGTAGLWAIKRLGGVAVVQAPEDALFPSMPESAIAHVEVDHIVPLTEIAPLLARLVASDAAPTPEVPVPDDMDIEVRIAKEENPIDAGLERVSTPSSYACPECHGVLLQLKDAGRIRFRCHTGHAYSVESLLAAVSEGIEESLWIAIRSLEEGRMLMSRMAEHVKTSHDQDTAERLLRRAQEVREQSAAIRQMVSDGQPLTTRA
jgi:two-component system, chemotaxis family, protein-glutamate methylesterase/glutaminase